MRYLGNKDKLIDEITSFIESLKLDREGLVFCDLFSGTGSVGYALKNRYKIIANDNLYSSYILTQSKLNTPDLKFKKINFNPFEYLNDQGLFHEGFVYKNYAPTKSKRKYFNDENSKRIDFIRSKIEDWYKQSLITTDEYYYLIACLLESVSKVANVAGVYGSFLKNWDPRALKPLLFKPLDLSTNSFAKNTVYNEDVFEILNKVKGDILYIDPPYTKNQYSVQYHIPETIAKYDNPLLFGKTGKRDTSKQTSVFSQPIKCEISFERLISESKFKHIILSYSSAGIMTTEFIESVMKRYGKEETFRKKIINYKKYLNSKTTSAGEHVEYLFYIEKSNNEDIRVASPLNYIGGKYDMVPFIKSNLPNEIDAFIDVFGGGFNVGININAKKIVYNDSNTKVREIVEMFQTEDTAILINYILRKINSFNLKKMNKESYIQLRNLYNLTPIQKRDPRMLYLLLMYGFQQQLRFNSKMDYNNPIGQAGFNHKIYEKIISFSREIKNKKIDFFSSDFENLIIYAKKDNFFYCDPPYLITLGSYNDGKRGFGGWTIKEEKRLYSFLEKLNSLNIKFMLSNVLIHNNIENSLLREWISKNKFKITPYTIKSRTNTIRREVIITNYENSSNN